MCITDSNLPNTFFVVLLGIIAVAGIPPLSGFVGKWMLYEALIQQKLVFLAIVTFAASTGSFLYLYRLIFSIFLGQRPERFDEIKEVPWLMRIPMLILALLTVYLGAYPYKLLDLIGYVEQSFMGIKPLAPGMTVLLGSWGGVNTLTAISVVGASFVSVLIILSFYKRSHKVGQLDIHTAGEIPKPEVNLHFAVNFFQPFSRGMAPLLKHSFGRFFDKIGENLEGLFDLLRYFYTGNGQTYALYVIVFLVFLLIFGGQVL
jgi:NADH-quinone oxidoreductase subunit M